MVERKSVDSIGNSKNASSKTTIKEKIGKVGPSERGMGDEREWPHHFPLIFFDDFFFGMNIGQQRNRLSFTIDETEKNLNSKE